MSQQFFSFFFSFPPFIRVAHFYLLRFSVLSFLRHNNFDSIDSAKKKDENGSNNDDSKIIISIDCHREKKEFENVYYQYHWHNLLSIERYEICKISTNQRKMSRK